jgi:hypothetical protein
MVLKSKPKRALLSAMEMKDGGIRKAQGARRHMCLCIEHCKSPLACRSQFSGKIQKRKARGSTVVEVDGAGERERRRGGGVS